VVGGSRGEERKQRKKSKCATTLGFPQCPSRAQQLPYLHELANQKIFNNKDKNFMGGKHRKSDTWRARGPQKKRRPTRGAECAPIRCGKLFLISGNKGSRNSKESKEFDDPATGAGLGIKRELTCKAITLGLDPKGGHKQKRRGGCRERKGTQVRRWKNWGR